MTLNVSRIAVAAIAIALVTACSKGSDDSGTGKMDPAAENGVEAGPGSMNGAAGTGGMNDANIFYVLNAADMADSAKGTLASTKGTSADVREFAKMMVRDHHSLRQQGQDLAKRLAIQPAPPPSDSLPAKLDTAMSRLTAAAKGRDFDKAYVDHEVTAHLEVLSLVTMAMAATRNSEIKNLIQKAAPVIQAHLDRVQAIQKDLQK